MVKRYIDPELKSYCTTERQREYIDAVNEHGTLRAAAKALDTSHSAISVALRQIEARASSRSYAPGMPHHMKGLPGFTTDRISSHYSKDGSVSGWHIQNRDREAIAQGLQDFVEGLCEQIPKVEPVAISNQWSNTELMSSIYIGDAHIGMKAWAKATRGADFDVAIAIDQLREAIGYLVDKAPASEYGMIVDVGDFMHADSSKDQTFKGTPVDVDTRHSKVMFEAAKIMIWSIDQMLKKFEKVIVIITPGNHNTDSSRAIRMMLSFRYENEPRVIIPDNHGFSIYLEWGRWLFCYNHGDKIKPHDLVSCMAQDMSQAWGRTTHRMVCTGHYHQKAVTNFRGCEHRVFAALPPPDAWHSSMGYGGHGSMEMLTFKKSGGIHSSYVYTIDQELHEPDVKIA
jgi:hypothetical protein